MQYKQYTIVISQSCIYAFKRGRMVYKADTEQELIEMIEEE